MKDALRIFKALGDETRLKIVRLLLGGKKCVCHIYPNVERSQSTVSLQLKKLEMLEIVESERKNKFIFYSLKDKRIRKILKICHISKYEMKEKKC